MIVTVTPNPSLDKTVELDDALSPGQVQRAPRTHTEPGGKGVNISRALTAANAENLAILPGDAGEPVLDALDELHVPHKALRVGQPLRTNITVTDPCGITTKINEPGPQLDEDLQQSLLRLTLEAGLEATWIVLAGSLPPGMPEDFYRTAVTQLRDRCCATGAQEAPAGSCPAIAVDASGPALAAAVTSEPDLIKPNAEELLDLYVRLTHQQPPSSPETLEENPGLVVELVQALQTHGVRTALVTLGAHGAVLVPPQGSEEPALRAWGPAISTKSTVGAGDAALAGYLLARTRGFSAKASLQHAMAHGRAAASLPGSVMPTPEDLDLDAVVVEPIR